MIVEFETKTLEQGISIEQIQYLRHSLKYFQDFI